MSNSGILESQDLRGEDFEDSRAAIFIKTERWCYLVAQQPANSSNLGSTFSSNIIPNKI
jgi:hypothetical protein